MIIRKLWKPLLLKADIVKLNENELDQIFGWHNKVIINEKDQLQWFLEYYNCKIICVNKGKMVQLFIIMVYYYSHPGYKIKRDNVGTGAAFLAGFISSLISEKTIEQSLDAACATAALTSIFCRSNVMI